MNRRDFLASCGGVVAGVMASGDAASPLSAQTPVAPGFRFVDVTAPAGITFRHNSGAYGGKLLPETLGAGCAFLDYDADGWQDVVFVNGMDWAGHKRQRSTLQLYRNNRDGTFTDVTKAAGLDVEMYGMGVAVGDWNNDGFPDLFVTCVGQNRLFRNTGRGTFVDATRGSGLEGRSAFSTSALWFDFDRDGLLDLFVCNYVKWTAEHDVFCSLDGKQKLYCTPEAYRGETCWLFRNRGNGTFEDVTARCGIFDSSSKSLGVAMLDVDQDGWPDLLVANDTQPNKLYRNQRNGTFKDIALEAGLALSADGRARAGMGVDAADFDNSGRMGVAITNFDNEMIGLYRAQSAGVFQDVATRAGVGFSSLNRLGFGCTFADFDLDGALDLVVANGHIDETVRNIRGNVGYAQAPHLFLNQGAGTFRDIAASAGGGFAQPKVGRGIACADVDRDGDVDLLMTTNNGPAVLYRNDVTGGNRSLRLRLVGTASNRDAIGAMVRIFHGGTSQSRMVRSGSSYLSQSELPLTFGVGRRDVVDRVVITWPNGRTEEFPRVATGAAYECVEAKGIVPDRIGLDAAAVAVTASSSAGTGGYDVAIVGSGPNGLTAAALLGMAGLSVVVLERHTRIGGSCRTEAATRPGFLHDVCAAIHPMARVSPVFHRLGLEAHGLEWVSAPLPLAHPFDDGSAAVLSRGLAGTVENLGRDGARWQRLVGPFVADHERFFAGLFAPVRVPRHPVLMARFGAVALQSCVQAARRFEDHAAAGLLAGMAAHSMQPLDAPASVSVGLALAVAGHAADWPCARGGSQAVVDALAAKARASGCEIRTEVDVRSLADVPTARAVLFDVTPRQLVAIAGDALPSSYVAQLRRFRYGPGTFKIEYALSAPIPWRARACADASTVHVGGTCEEIARCEAEVAAGRVASSPFVLVTQQSRFDDTRAPAGQHTGSAYCHVPHGCAEDVTDAIERQIERFAPGFRDVILARACFPPAALEAHNANLVGGDIGGGANSLGQLLLRPVPRWDPYSTPNPRLFLCSSSTPPGGGVHGMCGYGAARSVLARMFRRPLPPSLTW